MSNPTSRAARWLVFMAALLAAGSAFAWPVDWVHDVTVDEPKFVKLPAVDWFEVEDPRVASVEWMAEANELIVTGLKPGRTLVLLGAQGKVAAWRVRVAAAGAARKAPEPNQAPLLAAQKACPSLQLMPLEEVRARVKVGDEKCRAALSTLFQTDAFEARSIELEFEGAVLQAQLRSIQEGLRRLVRERAQARYVGAGLVLTGTVSPAEHRAILWEVLRRTIGRFALDDQLELSQPDAGG